MKRVNPSPHTMVSFWVTLVSFWVTLISEVPWGPEEMEILEEDQRVRTDMTEGVGGIHLCGNMKAGLTRQ